MTPEEEAEFWFIHASRLRHSAEEAEAVARMILQGGYEQHREADRHLDEPA